MDDLREIPVKIAAEYAEEVGAVFTETSAKTAANIKELFIAISEYEYDENHTKPVGF